MENMENQSVINCIIEELEQLKKIVKELEEKMKDKKGD